MPKSGNDSKPPIVRTKNKTIVGTGCFIDQAEILKEHNWEWEWGMGNW